MTETVEKLILARVLALHVEHASVVHVVLEVSSRDHDSQVGSQRVIWETAAARGGRLVGSYDKSSSTVTR
jgi:hypothetical protein